MTAAADQTPAVPAALELLPPVPTRAQIEALEDWMAEQPGATGAEGLETHHFFAPGLCARRIIIPKGQLLSGRRHRFGHMNFVQRGLIKVWTAETGVKLFATGAMIVSGAGAQRVGCAVEETIFTTVHAVPAHITTPEAAEEFLVEPVRPELAAKLLKGKEALCLSSQ